MENNSFNHEKIRSVLDNVYADTNTAFNFPDFKATLERSRSDLVMSKDILKDQGICMEYDELQKVPEGRFTIMRDGVRMESLFISCPDSPFLFVVLDGARSRNGLLVSVPKFDMWSWQKKVEYELSFRRGSHVF